MRRRFSNILLVLSLVLCLASTVMWVRSYWARDGYVARRLGPAGNAASFCRIRSVASSGGCVTVGIIDVDGVWPNRPRADLSMNGWLHQKRRGTEPLEPMMPRTGTVWNRLGFDVQRQFMVDRPATGAAGMTTNSLSITFPWWAVILTAAIPPAVASRRRHRQRQRRRKGLCPTCGYDLRASKHQCPECGKPVSTKVSGS